MKSNYSVTKLFVNKDIQIVCGKQSFTLKVPNLKEYYSLDYVNATYHLISQEDENYIGQDKPFKNTYEFAMALLFQIGFYDKF